MQLDDPARRLNTGVSRVARCADEPSEHSMMCQNGCEHKHETFQSLATNGIHISTCCKLITAKGCEDQLELHPRVSSMQ
eukprot:366278-Chlamydomonas_euryale.AAC.20